MKCSLVRQSTKDENNSVDMFEHTNNDEAPDNKLSNMKDLLLWTHPRKIKQAGRPTSLNKTA